MAVESQQADNAASADTRNENASPGMIVDVKNLYLSKPDKHGRTSWIDEYPDDLAEAAENAESARFALLIRNKKSYDGRKKLEIDSFIVQSPLLKKSLGRILSDYPGITTNLDRLVFKAPFQCFIHRWKKLLEELENEADAEIKSHLVLLHRILEAELQHNLKARNDFIVNGVITYDTCWMIFEPGTIVHTTGEGHSRAVRLEAGQYV